MKRTATTAGMDNNQSQPPPKRPKVSHASKPFRVTPNEMKEFLQLFKHLQSQNIQNRTLDRCLYDTYLSLSNTLNKDNKNHQSRVPNTDAFLSQIGEIVSNKRIIHCNLFIEQLIQLKSQIKAIRLLARDIGLSPQISDLCHGVDNVHSWQRPYIDPLRTQNPSVCEHSKYDLESAKKQNDDQILIDSTPQTIEELVYQNEYIGLKKLVHRRRVLMDYITKCEAVKSSKNTKNVKAKTSFNVQTYKKSRDEMQLLDLCELQNKVRNEIIQSQMDRRVYEEDDGENEALLNPDLFARSAQIGLHFDPHVNSANHPPTMACSSEVFPFYYVGKR